MDDIEAIRQLKARYFRTMFLRETLDGTVTVHQGHMPEGD